MRAIPLLLLTASCSIGQAGLLTTEPTSDAAPVVVTTLPDDAGPVASPDASGEAAVIDYSAQCAAECPAAGGTCGPGGVCNFDCSGFQSCSNEIVCPPNIPCHVGCTGVGSCSNSIACGGISCTVECGAGACQDDITCTAATCNIGCSGLLSCGGNVTTTTSGASTICCTGNGACYGEVACSGATCGAYCKPYNATCGGGQSCTASTCVVDAGLCP